MPTPLTNGYNVIIHQRISANEQKPIYPTTRFANVYDEDGNNLSAKYFVPTPAAEADTHTFLRNDNTWATLPTATAAATGLVKITSDTTDVTSTDAAITPAYLNSLKGAINGLAPLGSDSKIAATYLPSYVDDVVEAEAVRDAQTGEVTSMLDENGDTITPEAGKIYIDCLGQSSDNTTYRWGGVSAGYVAIRGDLSLGYTHSSAMYGDEGLVAYRHAMNLDTSTGQATTNTNPHGTTKTDVGLGNVDNVDEATIIADTQATIDDDFIVTALGYTPVRKDTSDDIVTASANGIMSAAMYQSFVNMQEIILTTSVGASEPTFASGKGIWLETTSVDA